MGTVKVGGRCLCGETSGRMRPVNGIDVVECEDCGIFRQPLDLDEDGLREWYAETYHEDVYSHSYDQDVEVARKRLDAYDLPPGSEILDVGAGNGAFVDVATGRGYEATGQEPGEQLRYHPQIYTQPLAEIGFPSDSFDVVTLHDVLEHVADPRALLREIRRVLRDDGRLILDFPNFWKLPEGRHHWKPIEHVWMLSVADVELLLAEEGLAVEKIDEPIPSKLVFYADVVPSGKTTVLVPPGIGDGYWCAVKLRGFAEKHGIDLPVTVEVHDSGPRRSEGFWRRVPFVRWGGYRKLDPVAEESARKLYVRKDGPAVVRGFGGCDYFMTFNAVLDSGRSLDSALPGAPSEWRHPFFRPKHEALAASAIRREVGGPYVVTAFWSRGFYRKWLAEFNEADIVETLLILAGAGLQIVVTGAEWDVGGIATRIAKADPRFHDYVGQTTFDEYTELLAGAAGVFGFPAGTTMLGPFYDIPTVLLWQRRFPQAMWTNSVAPSDLYRALDVEGLRPVEAASQVVDVVRSRWRAAGDPRMRHA